MNKRFSKKAFTMIELLVCLVCLGFLAIGIGAFASAVESNAVYISDREALMLHEYQDMLHLKSNGTDDTTQLKNPEFLFESEKIVIGTSFNIRDYFTIQSNQMVECSTNNSDVLTVQESGSCTARAEGIAYIKVNILTMDSDGIYHDTKDVKYIPVIVYNNSDLDILANLNYYFYGGKYYTGWVYGQ